MLEIEYKGANSIVVNTKRATLVFDPRVSLAGLRDIAVKGVVQIVTEHRFAVEGGGPKVLIDGPGEYEVGDVSIKGIPAQRHIDTEDTEKLATIYRLETNDVRIAVLGNIAPKLAESQLEALGVVDILILPVGGGGYTLDATSAVGIVRQIEPRVVIPVHFAEDGVTYEVPQDTIDVFIKELNVQGESVAKYKLKSASALPESLAALHIARTA